MAQLGLLFLVLLLVRHSCPASILAVVPTLSVSHFGVFDPLLADLLERGHSLVVVSGYPVTTERPYEHVNIQEAKETFNGSWSLHSFPQIPAAYRDIFTITRHQVQENDNIFRLRSVQQLLSSSRRFDLVIVEQFISDVFLALAATFQAPFIAVSACPPLPWAQDRHGAPGHLASQPNLFSGFGSNMGFAQRVVNLVQVSYAKLYHKFVLQKISQEMARQFLGPDVPPLEDLVRRSSLFLVNSHFTFFSASPLPPQVVEVGGIHVRRPKPLSQNGFSPTSECSGANLNGSTRTLTSKLVVLLCQVCIREE